MNTATAARLVSSKPKAAPRTVITALFFHTAMFVNRAVDASDFGLDGFEFVCAAGKNAGDVVCVSADSKYETLKESD